MCGRRSPAYCEILQSSQLTKTHHSCIHHERYPSISQKQFLLLFLSGGLGEADAQAAALAAEDDDVDAAPAAEAEAAGAEQAEPAAAAAGGAFNFTDLFPPTGKSAHRAYIVGTILPVLAPLIQDAQNRGRSPRSLVDEALNRVDRQGNRDWGANRLYSRRRTCADAVISQYFNRLHRFLVTGE